MLFVNVQVWREKVHVDAWGGGGGGVNYSRVVGDWSLVVHIADMQTTPIPERYIIYTHRCFNRAAIGDGIHVKACYIKTMEPFICHARHLINS